MTAVDSAVSGRPERPPASFASGSCSSPGCVTVVLAAMTASIVSWLAHRDIFLFYFAT